MLAYRKKNAGHKARAQSSARSKPGGHLAHEGTEPDKHRSSGKLLEGSEKAWQSGPGIDGNGRSR